MLAFVERGKPENPEKNPRRRDKNQQQTQPTYDAESGNGWEGGRVGMLLVGSSILDGVSRTQEMHKDTKEVC